jgi:hypothetical protein
VFERYQSQRQSYFEEEDPERLCGCSLHIQVNVGSQRKGISRNLDNIDGTCIKYYTPDF